MEKAYQKLEKKFEDLAALSHAMGILGWDEQTMMPEKSGDERAFALSKLASFSHRVLTDPMVGDLIAEALEDQKELDTWQEANLKAISRNYEKAKALPSDFVEKKRLATMKAQQAWRKCRVENDWKSFLPYFEENIKLTQEEAQRRADGKEISMYDALVDLYEPGLTASDIDALFDPLEKELPDLIFQAEEKSQMKLKNIIRPNPPFSIQSQEELGREVMRDLCYDFSRGRLDVAFHPFCGGARGDVRITTRYREDDFQESLMGVIHETGHAQYEQNLPKAWGHQPVGSSTGMAIHESQSLFFEMQIGRSREFLAFMAPKLKKTFSHVGADVWSLENLVPLYQEVKRDFIRVNADEVTYPAHVIMRYHMEKSLLNGELLARDLPEMWNEQMKKWLGLETLGNDKNGCMQDVHWPSGAIGYFPTYTVGAIIAAQLCQSYKRDCKNWSEMWAKGEFETVRAWLKEKIWSNGSRFDMKELAVSATGRELGISDYLNHLKERYL